MSNYIAWIITIGNELLIGKIVNTNASWIAKKLTFLGYQVKRIITVPDDINDICEVIKDAINRKVRLVITTGGLGPTPDDMTSEALSKALNKNHVINEEALEMIKRKFEEKGYELTKPRLKQAMMPEGSKPIPNPVGTAPGIWIEYNSTIIIALPGVPSEMMVMFENYVEPKLREIGPKLYFLEKTMIVKGVPESEAAPIIENAMKKWTKIYIKSHPKGKELEKPILEIHIYSSSENIEETEKNLNEVLNYLKEEFIKLKGEISI